MYIGDERLKSEHSLERELLNLGITDGKRYKMKMDDANLLVPDTSYRSGDETPTTLLLLPERTKVF